MNVREAYNLWATQYDTNKNQTRDLEALALRSMLGDKFFENGLEIGCGTGKNTVWLSERVKDLLAVDLSEEMLAKAKEKIEKNSVRFLQADITEDWTFAEEKYDLVIFSLVLEHIENLGTIFEKLIKIVSKNGLVYIGELHPFKQYLGTKARFETEEGLQIVTCFNHHISDFYRAAKEQGFELLDLQEFFDQNDRNTVPRVLAMVFRKI